ncbi:lysozyme inhibitor LprI family protein [Cupriavidus sp. AU9028]|uniref:lysozyme inhibitor LprI family protein n=1 Tax=Cupriavidus sp. AU9028 TaxID=2871157 RepID=UPI001C98141A|nr:lysozyme inhibitor LprI family protein [Cupriavidus sp. AU9028]MBY4896320.1 DUF1311 domain-containing protein [Cupriavidus sp. AU9028]
MTRPHLPVLAVPAATAVLIATIALAGCLDQTGEGQVPRADIAQAPAEGRPSPLPASAPSQASVPDTVEAAGICQGLDLAVTLDMRVCLDRRFKDADRQLNARYQQLMASRDDAGRAQLQREQRRWIRDKESKCPKAGEAFAGGTLESVVIADCFVTMTEQRLRRLLEYR